jgi:segregation and condensation protein A
VELRPRDLIEALRRMQSDEEDSLGAGKAAPLRVRRHAVNLRQRMDEVLRSVSGHHGPYPFSALLLRQGRRLARGDVLVTFLAVLELVRIGQVSAWQDDPNGEILLLREENAPPAQPTGSSESP